MKDVLTKKFETRSPSLESLTYNATIIRPSQCKLTHGFKQSCLFCCLSRPMPKICLSCRAFVKPGKSTFSMCWPCSIPIWRAKSGKRTLSGTLKMLSTLCYALHSLSLISFFKNSTLPKLLKLAT